jgi:hypothetical protein
VPLLIFGFLTTGVLLLGISTAERETCSALIAVALAPIICYLADSDGWNKA